MFKNIYLNLTLKRQSEMSSLILHCVFNSQQLLQVNFSLVGFQQSDMMATAASGESIQTLFTDAKPVNYFLLLIDRIVNLIVSCSAK